MVTDSETFYKSLLGLLDDLEEKEEVNALLSWWDRYAPFITSSQISLHSNFQKSLSSRIR
jgi:hypothetical protein